MYHIVFLSYSASSGYQLWSTPPETNAVSSGPAEVIDNFGTPSDGALFLTDVGGEGYFEENGNLWEATGFPGGAHLVATLNATFGPANLGGNNSVVVFEDNNNQIWEYLPSSGSASEASNFPTDSTVSFLTTSPASGGSLFYFYEYTSSSINFYSLNSSTSQFALLANNAWNANTDNGPSNIGFALNTVIFWAPDNSSSGNLVALNLTNNQQSVIGTIENFQSIVQGTERIYYPSLSGNTVNIIEYDGQNKTIETLQASAGGVNFNYGQMLYVANNNFSNSDGLYYAITATNSANNTIYDLNFYTDLNSNNQADVTYEPEQSLTALDGMASLNGVLYFVGTVNGTTGATNGLYSVSLDNSDLLEFNLVNPLNGEVGNLSVVGNDLVISTHDQSYLFDGTALTTLTNTADAFDFILLNNSPTSAAPDDFNGLGTSDVLLQGSSGNLVDWAVQNGVLSFGSNINNPALSGYSTVHNTFDSEALTGDFNGDGTTDILLQNSSGNLVDWIVQNGTLSSGNEINNPAAYGYQVVATGYFNGDGTTDLLLQNSSGNLTDWIMENGTLSSGNNINNPSLYGYSLVGTGDFNGDGTTDLLLQNSSGNLVDWTMKNGVLSGGNNINNPSLYGYTLVGTGDFNGDGTADLLLQNSSGNLVDWIMQNGTLSSGNNINNPSLYGYSFVGTGDYNGDGTSDLLLRNSSGNLVDWTLTNGTLSGGNNIGNPTPAGYHVA
jgi:hypothetical protein